MTNANDKELAENFLGTAGSVLLGTTMGVGAAESFYRKFGPAGNNGLIKPVINSMFDAAGVKKPFDDSKNIRSDGDNSKPTNSTNAEQKNSVNQGTPPNSDKDIISKDGGTSKSAEKQLIFALQAQKTT